MALVFILFSRLTHPRMPDAISVRQVSGLPRASFRFHFAVDTLAAGDALGATFFARDIQPLVRAHVEHNKKKRIKVALDAF